MEDRYEQDNGFLYVELLLALKEKIVVILISFIVAAVVGWGVSSCLITPKYEASVNMIVNVRIETTENVTNDDISSAQKLVNTYAIIIKSNLVLNEVIKNLKLELPYEELYELVSVDSINNTQIMKIAVQNENAALAKQIVEEISKIVPDIVAAAVEVGSCKIVSQVTVGSKPISPDIQKNAIIAGLIGLLMSVCVIILKELMKNYIEDDLDIQKKIGIPVLGMIPDVDGSNGCDRKGNKTECQCPQKNLFVLDKNSPFAYVEAFKFLRTNMDFISSASGAKCILVTSAVAGESNSTTVINLAVTLADSGKSVIVVECNLRKPMLGRYLDLPPEKKGLSQVLDSNLSLEECIVSVEELRISVILAGMISSNPSELLNQAKMQEVIQSLKQQYDYVILDAPPVMVVTDAAVVGRMTDGAILVVRSRFAPANIVHLAKQRLEAVDIKVLGAVLSRYKPKKMRVHFGYAYEVYEYDYGQNKSGK